jgi:hypothetical protein
MTFRLTIYFILASLLITGCGSNFGDINTPPGAVTDVDVIYLLSTSITKTAYGYQEEGFFRHPASAGRYTTLVRNETMDKFAWGPATGRRFTPASLPSSNCMTRRYTTNSLNT